MKIICGLGNPGKEYENTRHNIGFSFIDFLSNKLNISFTEKFKSLFGEINIGGEKLFLQKPQTFMNRSGEAVGEIIRFYKIDNLSNLIVIFDDLDIVQGEYKIQKGKYPKVHNGINDILEKLGNDQFYFVRIGIDGRTKVEREFIKGREYVLQKVNYDFKEVFERILTELKEKEILNY